MSLERDYIMVEEIGQGAMATIHRALQRSLDRVVAIKRVHAQLSKDEQFVLRFEREAKASAHLKHVNIVDIIDFGRDDDGRHYLVMEYIDGPTLEKLLDGPEKLPLDVVLSIMTQILAGLDHAHNNDIIHRDIKPANIMLTTTGLVKVTDFGVAQAANLPSLTKVGTIVGTPSYMSPEQAGGRRLDHRSDLYSAGTVLYQMLAQGVPYRGETLEVLHKIINDPPPSLAERAPDTPPAIVAVVTSALQKDVTNRFFDAGEFAHAIETAASDLGMRIGQDVLKNYLEQKPEVKADRGVEATPSQLRQAHPTPVSWGKRPSTAILPLTGCFGCQVNLLDLHEDIVDLVRTVDVRFTPLMDVKEIPKVDIGIVEGCIANSENEERVQQLRERCGVLVALGSCACFGGAPALRNLYSPEEVLDRAYRPDGPTAPGNVPLDGSPLPALTSRVRAVQQLVPVDLAIPGCPSPPQLVLSAMENLITGREQEIPTRNLCHECTRYKKELLSPQRKFIADDVVPVMSLETIDPNLCLLEQGVLCMGLATREGCGARCPASNVPCTGCMGPTPLAREGGLKWLDALASLLPGGVMRFKHDIVGSGYRFTMATSMMPTRQDSFDGNQRP